MRTLIVFVAIIIFGGIKLPLERALTSEQHRLNLQAIQIGLDLRQQIGQAGFVAALSGFRSLVADSIFIQAETFWERTEWGRLLVAFQEVTTLQPRVILFWDMAAWHMGWNASVAALNDPTQPRLALRVRAQRQYLALARDFLERGVRNNPDRAELFETLGRLYREKYHDHERASEYFWKASEQPTARGYNKRFAAYELSYCEGREREAYDQLCQLYLTDERERLPTLIARMKFLEAKLDLPPEQRIQEPTPIDH